MQLTNTRVRLEILYIISNSFQCNISLVVQEGLVVWGGGSTGERVGGSLRVMFRVCV